MNEIVNKILELEKRAESLVSETKKDEKMLEKELDNKISKLEKSIEREAQQKIEDAVRKEEEQAKAQIDKIEKAGAEKKKALDKTFAENRDKWTERIFRSIIK